MIRIPDRNGTTWNASQAAAQVGTLLSHERQSGWLAVEGENGVEGRLIPSHGEQWPDEKLRLAVGAAEVVADGGTPDPGAA